VPCECRRKKLTEKVLIFEEGDPQGTHDRVACLGARASGGPPVSIRPF
jgi:hypothetical protein